jgi:hypothetical protein
MVDGIGVSGSPGAGSVNTWDGLHVRAKRLEAQLEVRRRRRRQSDFIYIYSEGAVGRLMC